MAKLIKPDFTAIHQDRYVEFNLFNETYEPSYYEPLCKGVDILSLATYDQFKESIMYVADKKVYFPSENGVAFAKIIDNYDISQFQFTFNWIGLQTKSKTTNQVIYEWGIHQALPNSMLEKFFGSKNVLAIQVPPQTQNIRDVVNTLYKINNQVAVTKITGQSVKIINLF